LECLVFLLPILARLNLVNSIASVLPSILADFTNEERKEQSLQTLAVNEVLNKAAELKAQDMARNGYFAHTSPDGKTPWYWLSEVGYSYQYAGENLAVNFSDSKDVTEAWMASPTHKANIVKENYTEVGTGVAVGIYEGRETLFVAQVYANPLRTGGSVASNTNKKIAKVSTSHKKSNNVLGAENDTRGVDSQISLVLKTNEEVVSSVKNTRVNLLKRIISSPRDYTNKMLFVVFGVIALAILLKIIIKFEHRHHLDLITNGFMLLALVGAIFVTNYYLTHHNMVITQNIDYGNQNL